MFWKQFILHHNIKHLKSIEKQMNYLFIFQKKNIYKIFKKLLIINYIY